MTRDTWNPWHGCIKCSEGCQNCYRDLNGSDIYRTKGGFDYPIQKNRKGCEQCGDER